MVLLLPGEPVSIEQYPSLFPSYFHMDLHEFTDARDEQIGEPTKIVRADPRMDGLSID